MKKKLALGVLSLVVFSGVYFSVTKSPTNQVEPAQASTSGTTIPTVEVHTQRYKQYSDVSEIRNESKLEILADFVEKKPAYKIGQVVLSDNVFHVKKVLKGDKSLENTDITVAETGGVFEGKKYVASEDELFDQGKYLLFLNQQSSDTPYYVVGVFSGKFKLSGGMIKGYGADPIRTKAEKLSETEITSIQ